MCLEYTTARFPLQLGEKSGGVWAYAAATKTIVLANVWNNIMLIRAYFAAIGAPPDLEAFLDSVQKRSI